MQRNGKFLGKDNDVFAQKDNPLPIVKGLFTPILQKYFYTASSILCSLAGCDHTNNGVSFEISSWNMFI